MTREKYNRPDLFLQCLRGRVSIASILKALVPTLLLPTVNHSNRDSLNQKKEKEKEKGHSFKVHLAGKKIDMKNMRTFSASTFKKVAHNQLFPQTWVNDHGFFLV